ncbi:hypothetical protein GJ496_009729 [Pomphorhynchus laevis]|nr:hypothetical protein GJ496_009729 [Pomphorhynchus laevis]
MTYNLKISDIQEIDEGDYVIQIQNSNNQHTLHGFTTLKLIKEHKPANNETLSWINGNLRNSVKVNREEDRLKKKLYSKLINIPVYIHPNNPHPAAIKRAMIFGEGLRRRRPCFKDDDFEKSLYKL